MRQSYVNLHCIARRLHCSWVWFSLLETEMKKEKKGGKKFIGSAQSTGYSQVSANQNGKKSGSKTPGEKC